MVSTPARRNHTNEPARARPDLLSSPVENRPLRFASPSFATHSVAVAKATPLAGEAGAALLDFDDDRGSKSILSTFSPGARRSGGTHVRAGSPSHRARGPIDRRGYGLPECVLVPMAKPSCL